jgi:hypothetical protein
VREISVADPDPHGSASYGKSDPDPHKTDADPQHCWKYCQKNIPTVVRFIGKSFSLLLVIIF